MTTRNSEKNQPFDNPFTENFIPAWEEWKTYKKIQHKFTYTSVGEKAAMKRLVKLSGGNEAIAIQMLEEAAGNGWKGFFELKTLPNAANNANPTTGNKAGSVSRERIQAAKDF